MYLGTQALGLAHKFSRRTWDSNLDQQQRAQFAFYFYNHSRKRRNSIMRRYKARIYKRKQESRYHFIVDCGHAPHFKVGRLLRITKLPMIP